MNKTAICVLKICLSVFWEDYHHDDSNRNVKKATHLTYKTTLHVYHTFGKFLCHYYTITMMWNSLSEVGWQSGQLTKTPFSFAIGTLTWTLIILVSQPCYNIFIIYKEISWPTCMYNVHVSRMKCGPFNYTICKKISNIQSSWNKSFVSIFFK